LKFYPFIYKRLISKIIKIDELPYISSISKDDFKHTERIYKLIKFLNYSEWRERSLYIDQSDKFVSNNLEKNGFSNASQKINDLVAKTNLPKVYSQINWNSPEINKRKDWMWYYKPNIYNNKNILKLIKSISLELSSYLHGLPVLRSAYFWRSFPSNENNFKGSQLFHMDNNDWRQIRVLIPIEEVSNKNGNLEFIDKKNSKNIFQHFNYTDKENRRNKKRLDNEFLHFKKNIQYKLQNKNEIFYIDTGNCYHRGSRNINGERKMFALQFMTPFHIHTKIFNRNKDLNISKFFNKDKELKLIFKYFESSLPQKGY
jgi:hypothetical protein